MGFELPALHKQKPKTMKRKKTKKDRATKSFEEDLIPNALIFLLPNWRTIARNQRERDYGSGDRHCSTPHYSIGRIDRNE